MALTVQRLEIVEACRGGHLVCSKLGLWCLYVGTWNPEIQERTILADAGGGVLIGVVEYGLEEGLLGLRIQALV